MNRLTCILAVLMSSMVALAGGSSHETQASERSWWVSAGHVLASPSQSFEVSASIALSGALRPLGDESTIRTMSVQLNVVVGSVLIATVEKGCVLDTRSKDSVVCSIMGLHPDETLADARTQLCGSPEDLESSPEAPAQEFVASPTPGLTWGDVSAPEQIVMELRLRG
ncbi:MAG: hypothetical protein H6825_01210 [Planctomycetes bacterium]|nr:hypothetical protein [Planctomycetota bacterium]